VTNEVTNESKTYIFMQHWHELGIVPGSCLLIFPNQMNYTLHLMFPLNHSYNEYHISWEVHPKNEPDHD